MLSERTEGLATSGLTSNERHAGGRPSRGGAVRENRSIEGRCNTYMVMYAVTLQDSLYCAADTLQTGPNWVKRESTSPGAISGKDRQQVQRTFGVFAVPAYASFWRSLQSSRCNNEIETLDVSAPFDIHPGSSKLISNIKQLLSS